MDILVLVYNVQPKYGQWLNDNLIDCLMFSLSELASEDKLSCIQLFSTQFYTKLISTPKKLTSSILKMSEAEKNHLNVQQWTKNINIFDKSINIYPINEERSHWYLIVVIFPSASDNFLPYMAVLDSDGTDDKKEDAIENIKNYIVEELKCKPYKSISEASVKNMKTLYPNLPQQSDGSSCGLFLVYYFKQILRQLRDNAELPTFFDVTFTWFSKHDLYNLRYDAAEMIKKKAKEQGNQDVFLPDIQFFSTAAEDKAFKRKKNQSKDENSTEQSTSHNNKKSAEIIDVGSPNKKRKVSFKEYIENIEKNEQDYTLIWSYGSSSDK